jgi:predicted anti-sigma-YlaC factor YlaD
MKDVIMKCNEIRELMPDLAAGLKAVTPETKTHLDSCAECAGKLEAFRQTMALLDEWRAPEPSPYFDVRLHARLREEAQKARGFLRWLRRPALAVSLAVLMVVSVTLVRFSGSGAKTDPQQVASAPAEPGTAVGDLQALDKNHDLYSDFDVLDDLTVQQDVTANP